VIVSAVLLIFGLLSTLILANFLVREGKGEIDVFVGVDIGYGDENDAIKLVDKVEDYVNLIVLGSLIVTNNTAKLTRVCDYIYQKGLHFIVYVGFAEEGYAPPRGPNPEFFTMAATKWGEQFLGVYLFDEAGGKQIDQFHPIVDAAENTSGAASLYVHHLYYFLGNMTKYYEPADFRLFTSDYALYWYDYLSGYDVVFGEFVGNQSRQLAVALCRGAAKTLGNDWGTMITWKHDAAPFLEDAGQLYDDMVLAYQNGAKYIIVFNAFGNFTATTEYGTLTPEHFNAMEKFWNYVNGASYTEFSAKTAYVLPRDYGYGFRGPNDKVWGLWEADVLSSKVWNDANNLLETYGKDLDIVYETKIGYEPITLPYDKLIFWNGTIIQK